MKGLASMNELRLSPNLRVALAGVLVSSCVLAFALACSARPALAADAPASSPFVCELLNSPVAFATAASPTASAQGDFNEDGIMDLAVSSNTSLSILIGLGSGGNGSGSFAAPVNIAVSGAPRHVITGDFNDDGITDLAVAVSTGAAILLGNGSAGAGNGSFGAATAFAAGSNPQRMAQSDFNEDGITDLVVTNSSSNTISVLLGVGTNGVGTGAFAAAVNYATGTNPSRVAIGDFNEDGIADLAVTNNNAASNSVSVLIGQGAGGHGDGTFAAKVDYSVGNNAIGIASGDFNEDGITDLVVVNAGSTSLSLLLGSGGGGVGNGTFAAATPIPYSLGGRDIVVADFSGNGVADLAVTNVNDDRVQVLLGLGSGTVGNGTFSLSQSDSVGQNPQNLIVGDFDEDGTPDVVAAKTTDAAVAVLRNGCSVSVPENILAFDNAGQVWPVATEQYIGWTRGGAVMAVNVELSRDGGVNWELLASNVTETSFKWTVTPPATDNARIRISDSAVTTRVDASDVDFTICAPFSAASAIPVGAGPSAAAVGDFNEDGIPDIAVACQSLSTVQILLGNGIRGVGNGTYAPPIDYGVDASPSDIVAGDFNDDGITDLAYTKPTANTIEFLIGEGVGGIGNGVFHIDPLCPPVAPGPSSLLTGDFNEDGITDLAVASAPSGINAILIGIGGGGIGDGSFAPAVDFGVDGEPLDMVSGDFNEDGILDLVAITDGTSNIMMLVGEGASGVGNGVFHIDPICPPVTPLHGAIVTGDFTSDGIADLVVTNPALSTVSIFRGLGELGVGDGTFSMPFNFPVSTMPFALQKGDFNIDGITDLAVAGTGGGGGGQLEVLYGGGAEAMGNGTFSCQMKSAIGAGAVQILAGDFLEDNSIDLLVVCSASGTIAPLTGGCQDPDFASINVTSPNGGEFLPIGSAHTVSWTTSEEIDAVNVEISRDGGNNWETIAHNTTESSISWTVTPPLSQNAWVRVSDSALPNRADMSNALFWIATPVGVGDPADDASGSGAAPLASALSAAYPNPSAGEVRFALALPYTARATFDVYDASGRLVRRLADRTFAAGDHAVAWDGRTADGARPSDGVYFLRAQWPGFEAVRKIVRVGGDR